MMTIRRILCPVDFLPAADTAFNYATALAASHGAKLKLIHVLTPIFSGMYPYPVDIVNPSSAMKKETRRQLAKLVAKAKAAGVSAESEVVIGDVDAEIRRAIAGFKPDLITMGKHGRRGFERWFMGSTTDRLLRHTPVPLLTIAEPAHPKDDASVFRRILVTTDFSEGTADAIAFALTIAQENNARITLMHVGQDQPVQFSQEERASFRRRTERALLKLVPAGVKDWCDVDTVIESGTPYQVILEKLEKEKVDLLVMNIHGKGMLERALLGSNAERIVRAARCPVILIPPKAKSAAKTRAKKQIA
jgi:nucleotide-binding universal stress UspA family protein